MPANQGRSFSRIPPGICDACGKGCAVATQVGTRCYRCFGGAFVSAAYFYFMEVGAEIHAIPLPEIAAAPAEALAVNVAEPPPQVLLERLQREYQQRFAVTYSLDDLRGTFSPPF